MPQLPKKFLRIRDTIFILPDDFNGEVPDAMKAFLQHVVENDGKPVEFADPNGVYTALGVILALTPENKVSYDSAIYKLIGDNYYIELPKRRVTQKENIPQEGKGGEA